MSRLIIVRGVSGSGKSTWARAYAEEINAVVISRDLIRLALCENPMDANEDDVTVWEDAAIREFLFQERNVIVDDTNINWAYVKRIANIGKFQFSTVELKVFDVPLEECIKRNDKRAFLGGREVPHDVIERQWKRFQETKDWTL